MKLTRTYEHLISLESLKPLIETSGASKGIWFPLCVENATVPDEYDDDGLTFGYPVASGNYAIATYEKAVGVLADDTLDLFIEHQTAKQSKESKLYLMDYFKPVTITGWDKDLPPESFHESERGFHAWEQKRQEAWAKCHAFGESQLPKTAQFIAQFNGMKLWHDPTNTTYHKDGLFYVKSPSSYDDIYSGRVNPVILRDDVEWDLLHEIIKTKLALRETQNQRARQFKENMGLLCQVFGYTADKQGA